MEKKYDLIVVGGGFAGVCAAMEAARHGQKVLLVEKFNCLGGAAVSCLVMPFMTYWSRDPETKEKIFLSGDLFLEVIDQLQMCGGIDPTGKRFHEEPLKLVLNRMCQRYGVDLLFNTTVISARTENGRILSLQAWGKSRMLELKADFYIDATGDAELSVLAGCRYQLGREQDNLCQPMTLSFRLGGVDRAKYLEVKPTINPLYQEFQRQGKITNPRENVLIFPTLRDDVLHFNTTRIVKHDPTDPVDVTRAEIAAREQVYEMLQFLQENIPGFENAYLQTTALQIGIRESRMVEGEYTLTGPELKALARFDDAIAVANYDIDIHNPEGTGTSHYYFAEGDWYQIPYRCLIPKDCTNMLVAGRCISSDHEAQASYRIMPFCAQLGQAAGAAISLARQSGKTLRTIDIAQLQTILRSEKFVI